QRASAILEEALALQEAGCFAIVFEAIPTEVTEIIMTRLDVPVIGIGAGPATDGQVLVFHDLLGIYDGFKPKFAKRFADVRQAMTDAMNAYAAEVRTGVFPGPEHCYHIPSGELAEFAEAAGLVPGDQGAGASPQHEDSTPSAAAQAPSSTAELQAETTSTPDILIGK
ncbi:3-methyl-2-oxobutanoate hydroxymethyltransferase, partial [Streptomyces sp. NPDC058247]|uniref:3-methyl-2-oxobutanoate hydroxymethyltransferase n=1 Tax=Streptomyces sp. NPDC058247 TaxID=3346401 RepID=UPI0036EC2306